MVSEAVWMPLEAVLERVLAGDGEYCLTEKELLQVAEKVKEIM